MQCPGCGERLMMTGKTNLKNGDIRRYRKCRGCGKRVRTREFIKK